MFANIERWHCAGADAVLRRYLTLRDICWSPILKSGTTPVLHRRLALLKSWLFANTQTLVVCQHWKAALRRCLASAAPVVCQRLAQCWSAALALLTGYNRNGTAPVVRIGSTPIFPPGMAKYLSTRDLLKGANSSTNDRFLDLLIRRSLG